MLIIVGVLASLISSMQVALQVRDVMREVQPEGVSWVTWELLLIQSIGLLAYSLARGESFGAAILTNGLVSAACIFIIFSVMTETVTSWPFAPLLIVGATGTAFMGILLIGSVQWCGTIGALASVVAWVPQAAHSFKTSSSKGLSWVGLLSGITSSLLWAAYAAMLSEWRLLVPPVSAIIFIGLTILFSLWRPSGRQDCDPRP